MTIPLLFLVCVSVLQYALIGFTDVLRDELRGSGIFVGTVNPGKLDAFPFLWAL